MARSGQIEVNNLKDRADHCLFTEENFCITVFLHFSKGFLRPVDNMENYAIVRVKNKKIFLRLNNPRTGRRNTMVVGFDMLFNLFDLLFPLMFLLVFGMIIFTMVSSIRTWNQNNHSPRLTVIASVIAKRTKVSHHHHTNGGNPSGVSGTWVSSSTSYYVTFQVESGDRMELQVRGSEYGMLVEGDYGKLSFQGTRYLGFERA